MRPVCRYVYNEHVHAVCAGLAAAADGRCYYLSAVGPKTALKSIWAGLWRRNGSRSTRSEWTRSNVALHFPKDARVRSFYAPLPGTDQVHGVFLVDEPGLFPVIRPEAALVSDQAQRRALAQEAWPQVAARFTAFLNDIAEAPVLAEWAMALWRAGWYAGYLWSLEAHGDCVAAVTAEPGSDWTGLIRRLVREGEVDIPEVAS